MSRLFFCHRTCGPQTPLAKKIAAAPCGAAAVPGTTWCYGINTLSTTWITPFD
jgi:hypothetical protein